MFASCPPSLPSSQFNTTDVVSQLIRNRSIALEAEWTLLHNTSRVYKLTPDESRLRMSDYKAEYAELRPKKTYYLSNFSTKLWKPLRKKIYTNLQVQSCDEFSFLSECTTKLAAQFSGSHSEFIQKLVEDTATFVYHLVRAENSADITVAIVNFTRLRNPGALFTSANTTHLLNYFKEVFGSLNVQSDDDLPGTNIFSSLRDYLDRYDEVKHSPIFQKMYRFSMYALSMNLFQKVGLTFDFLRYSKLEQEALRKKFHMGPDFLHALLDTMLFLSERGFQCMKDGNLDSLYHSGSTYETWFNVATDLKVKSKLLSFPEAQGIDRFEFLADLKDCIEKGLSIHRHATRIGEFERKMVKSVLAELQIIDANECTKREAQKERKSPFGILLYGGSAIGKTTLTKMLFYQYAKTFDLNSSSEFKYMRNANDPFWSGFNSSQWCVHLDDIAYMHPNKAPNGDASVMEMLQVMNNAAFVPNQADLSDKGRTPLRCELVVATTNCEDLNLYNYFQTPLAAQRRLPWVLDVEPKQEFARKDSKGMLDPSKTNLVDGKWPDYWNFVVKKVIPSSTERNRQQGELIIVHKFSSSDELLAWFSKEAIKHSEVQTIIKDCDTNMSQIEICKSCWLSMKSCECGLKLQTTDLIGAEPSPQPQPIILAQAAPTWREYWSWWFVQFMMKLLHVKFLSVIVLMILRSEYFRTLMERTFIGSDERVAYLRAHFRRTGESVERSMNRPQLFAVIAAGCVGCVGLYKFISLFTRTVAPPSAQGATCSKSEVDSSAIGRIPKPVDDERANVWHQEDFQLTNFDVSPLTTSYNSLQYDQLRSLLAVGMIHIRSSRIVNGQSVDRVIRATAVTSHLYVCNSHGLPDCDDLTSVLTLGEHSQGVNGNLTIHIAPTDIFRVPSADVAFIRIRNVPARRDISRLFMKETLRGTFKAHYLGRKEDGSLFDKVVHNVNRKDGFVCDELKTKCDSWEGFVTAPTERGDCGSLLIGMSGVGPIILGMHYLGDGANVVMSVAVTSEMISRAKKHFSEPHIQCGTPNLESTSAKTVLGPLSSRANVRWIPEGTANVYGSFVGFRGGLKSRVKPTLMSEYMVAAGYPLKHGKPVMQGYKPWNIALNDMVTPVTKIRNDVLAHCVSSFTNDIMSGLTQEDLAEVMVFDDITALNGASGVAYVDKINRGTSAGNPWKKSKKYFLTPIDPIQGLSDPVEATPEIMDRVNDIISGYEQNTRYMPVFCAHLKDEATKFSKIDSGKTRVFTGAPFDWSFVVRKYLLSTIRLIQRKRFLFESGPGTNCQSLEWEKIREYLVQHGEAKMVAGDYASFDKSMPSTIILAAFDILRNICQAAGYSEKELAVVQGIAEDTAFPCVDFNGDLMEFFGSNPSGHPLTVIINGLANSLYMRYVYTILNPEESCDNFKENVALMTYGDDNIMGVSDNCPWYNHSTIVDALANVGIKYTMADKEAPSVPYIHIDEASFLKRTWRYDVNVGAYLSPLEEDSIAKSLTISVESKTISQEAQAVAIMSSAHREYFFYGKARFENRARLLSDAVEAHGLGFYVTPTTFPSYSELKRTFWENSAHVLASSSQE